MHGFFLYAFLGITLERRGCGLVNCILMLFGRIIKPQLFALMLKDLPVVCIVFVWLQNEIPVCVKWRLFVVEVC